MDPIASPSEDRTVSGARVTGVDPGRISIGRVSVVMRSIRLPALVLALVMGMAVPGAASEWPSADGGTPKIVGGVASAGAGGFAVVAARGDEERNKQNRREEARAGAIHGSEAMDAW